MSRLHPALLAVCAVCFNGLAPAIAAQPAAEIIAPPAAKPSDLDTPEGRLGYALGLRIGGRIAADFKAQNAPLDPAALARGLSDAVLGVELLAMSNEVQELGHAGGFLLYWMRGGATWTVRVSAAPPRRPLQQRRRDAAPWQVRPRLR